MKKNNEKKSWIVKLTCVVEKEVICDDCTKEQAKSDPFGYASDERETHTEDWEVKSVEENT